MNLCESRPIKYEYILWDGSNYDECKKFTDNCAFLYDKEKLILKVQYGYDLRWQSCYNGDYIVKTFNGYYRVIKEKEFGRIYTIID